MKQAVATRAEQQLEVLRESVRQFGETVELEKAKVSVTDRIAPVLGLLLSLLLSLVALKTLFAAFLK